MVAQVQDVTTAERFWSQVDKSRDCWLWTGYLKPNSYASFYPGGGRHVSKVYAHRWVYEETNGPIPEGLEIDHLCHVLQLRKAESPRDGHAPREPRPTQCALGLDPAPANRLTTDHPDPSAIT